MRINIKLSKGFTLIELLIVIALLGALAVGLIGAIDPFEQLKKGSDTGVRDLVNQTQTAIIRYYSVKNSMPWAVNPASEALNGANMAAAVTNMIAAGELRSDFNTIQAGSLTKVWTTGTGAGAGEQPTASVCYKPTSKSFQSDPNTKYQLDGVLAAGVLNCKSANPPGTDDCYWCIQ
jgi:prepilin-type N-terminal cleavage/methylation domain-containing protein